MSQHCKNQIIREPILQKRKWVFIHARVIALSNRFIS